MRIFTYFIILIIFSHSLNGQVAVFKSNKEKDCNILKVQLDATSSTGVAPLMYFWDFGNGNSTSGVDKAIVDAIYVQPGTPEVSLYIIDGTGAKSAVVTKKLNILAGPKVDFKSSTSSTCSGKEIAFINTTQPGSSPITAHIWNIGSNVTLYDATPRYVFQNPGVYDVTLTVTDDNGCNVSLKKEGLVSIKNNFDAYFQADNTFECAVPFQTKFIDLTDYSKVKGHTFSHHWIFGDGTQSNLQHPEKVFSKAGSYGVDLYITDLTEGCVSRRYFGDYITVGGRKPRTAITLYEKRCSEYIYYFDPNSDNLPDNVQKSIDFGDGQSRTFAHYETFFHKYSDPGKYLIKTTYSDPLNNSCSHVGFDTVIVPEALHNILADKTSGCNIPMDVTFKLDQLPEGAFYLWEFGDGQTSKEKNPKHTYTTKGTFDVSVKIWNQTGCTYFLQKKKFITAGQATAYFKSDAKRIEEFPREFSTTPIRDSSSLWGGCIPFSVNFQNLTPFLSSGTYVWDFGDGNTSTAGSPEINHTYLAEGVYSPSLTVTHPSGCKDTYKCKNCVRAGNPPMATVTKSGPDTVCCEYDKTFAANVELNKVDLLWYNISLNDGAAPPGITKAYYKDSIGNWILENHTEEFFPFQPAGLGLHYMTTNLSRPNGNQPDFYFYAYKNGCAKKIEYPKYQMHVLPWGTFKPLPCETTSKLKAGDTLDFNEVGGAWFIGNDKQGQPKNLAKAVVTFELASSKGCSMAKVEQVYTSQTTGFELNKDAYDKISQAKLFPKIVLPECVTEGDQIVTSTYLYNAEDATKNYHQGKCMCEEHWPYLIGAAPPPLYEISTRRGCTPLKVTFKSLPKINDIKWTFEDGKILSEDGGSITFIEPGIYRFRASNTACEGSGWSDSIVVNPSPVAEFSTDKSSFCINPGDKNDPYGTVKVTDSSHIVSDTIVSWSWKFGKSSPILKLNSSAVIYKFLGKDIEATSGRSAIILKVISSQGCTALDSMPITLRHIQPAFSMERSTGCYDTLKLRPEFPLLGSNGPYNGNMTVHRYGVSDTALVYNVPIQAAAGAYVLLDRNGKYNVRMEIQGDAVGSCYALSSDSFVTVDYASLTPAFEIPGVTNFSCVPALINVTDRSTQWAANPIQTWDWNFRNLRTGMEIMGQGQLPPAFALNDMGYYNLTLAVVDKAGCKKSITEDSVIFIDALAGSIDSIAPPLCPGESGIFRGSSFNADYYFWDFGDGTVGSGLVVSHAYMHSGEKLISFIIADSSNCRKSYSGKILIKDSPEFSLPQDTVLCQGQTFKVQSQEKPDYTYQWNTGQSSSSIEVKQTGLFILTITDSTKKCPYSDSIHIAYKPLPKINIHTVPPVCVGETISINATIDSTVTISRWTKSNKHLQAAAPFSLLADSAYLVKLTVSNKYNCINADSIKIALLERPRITLQDAGACPQDSGQLIPAVSIHHSGFNFTWTQENKDTLTSHAASIRAHIPDTYTVTYGKPGCTTSASARFYFHPLPDTSTNKPVVILCEEDGIVPIDGGVAASYLWPSNNNSNRFLQVDTTGNYIVRIGNQFGCYAIDTIIVVNRCPPKIYPPNAFTPELDGENKFHTVFGYNIGRYKYKVFNRWGELLYISNSLHNAWNGMYRGELMPSGVYPWVIEYTGNNPDYQQKYQLEGKVTVVR